MPRSSPTTRKSTAVLVVGAALAVVLVRGLMALSRADEFRGEELYCGSFAWALAGGLPLDPTALPIIVHLRGSVLFGLLAVPIQALVGPSLLALKILAVAWSALAGALFAYVLDRSAGRRAAWAGVAIYATLPPSFQMVDVLALGSHGDVLVFLLASLAVLTGRPGPLGAGRALLFGATVGLGVLFSLQYVVALPAIALVWWRQDRGFWRRTSSAWVALAAVVAALPLPYLSRSATLVQSSVGDHLLPDGAPAAARKLAVTVARDLPQSWLFAENGGAALAVVWALGLALGLVLLGGRLRAGEPLAWFALVYPLLVLAAYAASDFELNLFITDNGMGSRYFMPVLPFLGAWAALAAGGRGPRWRALAPSALLVLAGALGWLALADPTTPWRRPPMRGTSFAHFQKHIEYAAGRDFPGRLEWARRLDPDWDVSRLLRYGDLHPSARGSAKLATDADFRNAIAGVQELPAEERAWLLTMAGRSLGRRARSGLAVRVLAGVEDVPGAEWIARGTGAGLMETGLGELVATRWKKMRAFAHLNRLALDLGGAAAARAAAGAGFQTGLLYTPYNDNYAEVLRRTTELLPELVGPWFRGLALGWRTRFGEETWSVPAPEATDLERALPERGRAPFRSALATPVGDLGLD